MVKKEYATKVVGEKDKSNFVPKEKDYGKNKDNKNYEKLLNRRAGKRIREALQNKKDDEDDDISQAPTLPDDIPLLDRDNKRDIEKPDDIKANRDINAKHNKAKQDKKGQPHSKNKSKKEVHSKEIHYYDYSEKVFNQRDYQFRRRQKELFDERNRNGSFFSESNNVDYSSNIKKRNSKKAKKKKDETPKDKQPKELLEKEDAKKASKKEKQRKSGDNKNKIDAKKANERMMYQKRYAKMREKLEEGKYYGKRFLSRVVKETKSLWPILAGAIVLFLLLYTVVAGATGVFIGSFSGGVVTTDIAESTWTSRRIDIDKAEDYFYHKMLDLDEEIDALKLSSYRFINVDDYLHYDHFALISYLSAYYKGTFAYNADIEHRLDVIFNNLFSYTYEVTTETYTSYDFDPDTGTFTETESSYDVLDIHITVLDIDDYAESTLNPGQLEHYYRMQSIEGGRQAFAAPAPNYRDRVKEYYTMENEHLVLKTVSGNPVYFLRNGTVIEVGGDYVIVENSEDGSKYMIGGITNISTTVGAEAVRGIRIADTTEEMTVKLWIDDEIINPLFYLRSN